MWSLCMSDIDDLLDELELDSPATTPKAGVKAVPGSRFPNGSISNPELSPAYKASSLGGGAGGESKGKAPDAKSDLLDDLLDDLDCVDSPAVSNGAERADSNSSSSNVVECHRVTSNVQGSGPSRKCFPVCLAGSRDEHGISPGRGCDNLR